MTSALHLIGSALIVVLAITGSSPPVFADDADDATRSVLLRSGDAATTVDRRVESPRPRHRYAADASDASPLRLEIAVWTLLAVRDYSPDNDDHGVLGELGVEFGVGNIAYPNRSPLVLRLGLGIGAQSYPESGQPDGPDSTHVSINLLAGFSHGDTGGDIVFQLGGWFRAEFTAERLLLANGTPAFGSGSEGLLLGGFVRATFRVGDFFSIPLGLYAGASLVGPRGVTFGIDLGGLLGLLYGSIAA